MEQPTPSGVEVLAAPAVPSRRHVAFAAAFFVALTALTVPPGVLHLRDRVANHTDSLFSVWRVSWVAHALATDPTHLFDANIFHPEPRALALSDAMIVPASIGAPMLWAGGHRIVVYNLLLLAGFALSGLSAYVLAYGLTRQTGAALLAGVVFAFAPYRFDHYEHLELQWAMWIPLGLWALHRSMASGSWRASMLVGASIALQMMSSMYYGVFFATYLVVLAPLAWRAGDQRRRGSACRRIAVGVVVSAVVLAPYLLPYVLSRATVGARDSREVAAFSARWTDFLGTPDVNRTYGFTSQWWGGSERRLFPGATAAALTAAALLPPWSAASIAYGAGGVLAVDLCRGTNGVLFPLLQAHVLPYRALRAPGRAGILVLLSVAVLAAIGFARVTARVRSRPLRTVAAALAIAVALFEYRTSPALQTVPRQLPPVYDWLRSEPPTVVAELPLPIVDQPDSVRDDGYMFYSTFHWHPLVNGYSGHYPASFLDLLGRMQHFPSEDGLAALRQRGVETLVVHEQVLHAGPLRLDPGLARTKI